MKFTRIGRKTKKLRLVMFPAWRRSHQPCLGKPQKGVNRNFSWLHLNKPYVVEKLSISEDLICSFSRIGQKIKNYSSIKFLPENLEKFRSPAELYHVPLEGSTIFLYRSSTSHTRLYNSRSAALKYAFFSRTGRNTKK